MLSQRCSQVQQPETVEVIDPEHPSVRTILGSTDAKILKIAKQVYQGEYVLATSVLPC